MKVTVESKKGLKTVLKVFIDKKTISEKIDNRLEELKKTVNIKGFRPGKVPINVLKQQFGKAAYGEALEKILQETSAKAIEEKKIKIAGHPKIDLKTYGEDKDLNYTLEIDELPIIKLKSIENIKFNDYEIKLTSEEVDKKIKEIAKNQNNFKDKSDNEEAKLGDLVTFDYDAEVDKKSFEGGKGKNTQIVLGKDLFIKGFDQQLLKVKKKQVKEVEVTLPENYPKKELVNKKAIFKCKIINLKSAVTTIVNDDFAKNLGAKDLNDLKKLISNQIQNQYKSNLDALSKDNILDQLEKLHQIEIPENLVEQELSLISKDVPKEDLEKNKKESEKIAKKRIKLGLILNEFGEKNNLKVHEQEIKNEIQKQIQSMPGQQKQILEFYQKNPTAAANLRGSIYEEKIVNLIKEKSKITKKIISTKEAEEIIKADHSLKNPPKVSAKKDLSKKTKKPIKSPTKIKKIRKK